MNTRHPDQRERGVPQTRAVDRAASLAALIGEVLELAYEQELTEHLGYTRHARTSGKKQNARNGSYAKTLQTSVGAVTVNIPRDRNGTFVPALVPKGQRQAHALEAHLMAMLLTGARVEDVEARLGELYGERMTPSGVQVLARKVHGRLGDWG